MKPVLRLLALLLIVAAGLVGWEALAPGEPGSTALSPFSEQARTPFGKAGQDQPIKAFQEIQGPLWSSTRTLTARENAEAHWQKHRREFPEYRSAQEYIEGAHRFLRGPPAGTETKHRPNGDTLYYHTASNTFAVQARNGAPRTMFRPRNGKRYWQRQ